MCPTWTKTLRRHICVWFLWWSVWELSSTPARKAYENFRGEWIFFVHWLLDTLINCWVLGNHSFSVVSDECFQCSRSCELTCVCLCILKLSDTQVFLQIHSSTDSSEVAFTAEQTLLFYFASSVIINCQLDEILIIILTVIRPRDWGKKWDTDNAKIIHKILWKLKRLLHIKISSQKMYTFIVYL